MRSDWRTLPFGPELRQPDQRSCGAACLVVARMVLDAEYAGTVAGRFDAEVLARHGALTGSTDGMGRAQLPWPRALGTPPWALARRLSVTGTHYRWRLARWSPEAAFARVLADVRLGLPAPVYVGSAWLPRHVVLGLAGDRDALEVYDPARGRLAEVSRAEFAAGRLRLSGWDRAWFTLGR